MQNTLKYFGSFSRHPQNFSLLFCQNFACFSPATNQVASYFWQATYHLCWIFPETLWNYTTVTSLTTHPNLIFPSRFQGLYYMRLSACKSQDVCESAKDIICSQSLSLSADVPKNNDVCEYEFPNNVSADIIDTSSRFPRFHSTRSMLHNDTDNWFCDIALR